MSTKEKNSANDEPQEFESLDDLLETLKEEELGTIGGGSQLSKQSSNLLLGPRTDAGH